LLASLQESPGSSSVASGYSSDVEEGDDRRERSANNAKRTENAYSVHKNVLSLYIDGGGACSVQVTLKPKAIKHAASNDIISVEGRLVIYETKNVDMVKLISWRATVCATNEEYVKLALNESQSGREPEPPRTDIRTLLAEQLEGISESPNDKYDVATPPNSPITTSPLDLITMARSEHRGSSQLGSSPGSGGDGLETNQVRSSSFSLHPSSSDTRAQELEISPMAINFGAVKLGKSVSSKFTVRNPTTEDISFAIFEVERHSGRPLAWLTGLLRLTFSLA